MIRTLAVAAAAAAVGYTLGQRAGDDEGSRFSKPEVTGDEVGVDVDPDGVVVKDGEIELCDDPVRRSRTDIDNPYADWEAFDEDEVIGVEDGESGLSDDLTKLSPAGIDNPYADWRAFDEDGRVWK